MAKNNLVICEKKKTKDRQTKTSKRMPANAAKKCALILTSYKTNMSIRMAAVSNKTKNIEI